MSRLRWTFAAVIALIATAAAFIVVNDAGADTVVSTPPSVTKGVTIERGDISVSESLDGTVEEIDTITVVHRIEGQTITTSTGSSTPSNGSSAQATNVPTAASAASAGLLLPDTDIETVALMTAADPPVDTTLPTDPVPTDPVPTEPVPADPVPADSIPSDTTPSTTTPVPVAPSAPSGSAGGAQQSAPTVGTSNAGGATAEPVTEMITGIAVIGTPVASGDVLYTVESRPVVGLAGALPAWRTMNSSSSDGADIAQLEAALVTLGYDPDGSVTVDTEWDSDTTAMVERWQVGLGVDDTGEVTLGSVVFIAHPATVASTSVAVGDEVSNGETVLALTGTVQRVIVEVPAELQASVVPSMTVDVAGTPGTVTRLRSADDTDGVTVQAVISPDTALDVEAGTSVKVTISHELAGDQLIVPTDAVVSRLDGTYAVQVVDATGGHEYITVEIIAVSGNRTAASGAGLSESTVLLAPA